MKPMWQKVFKPWGVLGEIIKHRFWYRWVFSYHGGESVLATGRSRTLLGAIIECENIYRTLSADVHKWERVDKEADNA